MLKKHKTTCKDNGSENIISKSCGRVVHFSYNASDLKPITSPILLESRETIISSVKEICSHCDYENTINFEDLTQKKYFVDCVFCKNELSLTYDPREVKPFKNFLPKINSVTFLDEEEPSTFLVEEECSKCKVVNNIYFIELKQTKKQKRKR